MIDHMDYRYLYEQQKILTQEYKKLVEDCLERLRLNNELLEKVKNERKD